MFLLIGLFITLLTLGILGAVALFCVGCLMAARDAARAKCYAEAIACTLPALLFFGGFAGAFFWINH